MNEFEDGDEDDHKSGSGSDNEMETNEHNETITPISYHGLQLQTDKDSMTKELYNRIKNTHG